MTRNQEPGTRNESEAGNGRSPRGFRKLRAWELADELASLVFDLAMELPNQHRWLADQMCRAAVSVPANIAEGYGRGSIGDYLRFLDIARGSLNEVEYFVHFAAKKRLIVGDQEAGVARLREETSRVLFGLWKSLKAKVPASWDHSGVTQSSEERAIYEAYEIGDAE